MRGGSLLRAASTSSQSDDFLIVLMAFAGPCHPKNLSVFASSASSPRPPPLSPAMAAAGCPADRPQRENDPARRIHGRFAPSCPSTIASFGSNSSFARLPHGALHGHGRCPPRWELQVVCHFASGYGTNYLSFSAMLRCSLRCGSVAAAQLFSSGLSPFFE